MAILSAWSSRRGRILTGVALTILAGAAALGSLGGQAWAHKPIGPVPPVLAEVREVLNLLSNGKVEQALSRARGPQIASRRSGYVPTASLEIEAVRLDRLFGAQVMGGLSRALDSRDPRSLRHVLRMIILLRILESLRAAETKMTARESPVAAVADARKHFGIVFEPILEEMDPLLHRELERALDRLANHATAVRLDAFRAEREAFLRKLADAFDLSLPAH